MFKLLTVPCYEPVPKKYLKLSMMAVLIIFILGATGCQSQTQYVKQTEYTYTPIPERLKKKCYVSPPPSVKGFVKASKDEQVDMLTVYSTTLNGDLAKCNVQVREIHDFDLKQQKVVKEQNDATKTR